MSSPSSPVMTPKPRTRVRKPGKAWDDVDVGAVEKMLPFCNMFRGKTITLEQQVQQIKEMRRGIQQHMIRSYNRTVAQFQARPGERLQERRASSIETESGYGSGTD